MHPENKTDFSSIVENVDVKAYALFYEWAYNAKKDYPFLDFIPENEDEISKDLKDVIAKGLQHVYEEEAYKKEFNIWGSDFLKNFIQINLNLVWYNKFILNHKLEYQHAVWLKSMLMYLEANTLALKHVNRLYKLILNNRNGRHAQPIEEEEVAQHQFVSDLICGDNWQAHKPFLEKMLAEYCLKNLNPPQKKYLVEMDKHFTKKELMDLINSNF